MSREDYVVDAASSRVLFKGDAVASYNSVTGAVEYLGSGKKRSRWIKEALALVDIEEVPQKEITDEMIDQIQGWRLDFEEVFPDAPEPVDNKVGFVHPEIAAWIAAKYPKFYEGLYPWGCWDADKANMGRNQSHPQRGVATSIELRG